ncbi:sugar ABC transporter substrate-binding protein [Candidatus Poriferisodalis sp.]|uniref:sugar ABC transporter substrate-binding protein n=1 Tax=Candidatus Poriferisodalis sp. TaxID=3101277 RepID=UPI003B02BB95
MAEPEVLWTVPANGNNDEWVIWDSTDCAYVPVADHPDIWEPAAVSSNGELVVGWGAQDTVNEVNITMNSSMDEAAARAEVELASVDYQFPSTSEPISAAQSIVVREPSVVVSNNQLDDVLESVNEIYFEACIPVVQVVTQSPGTVLFGPSNAGMGDLQGERLVAFANAQGWTADNSMLFVTFFSPAGPEVALRASVCADVVREAFPGIAEVEHDTTSTTSLELQNAFTDLLTANPDAENIISCTVADLWALANAEALKVSDRHTNAAVTGVNGGSAVLDAIIEGDTALVGSVDLGAAQWGEYWIPLAQDIAAGIPVPTEVFAPIVMLPVELPAS